MDSNAKVQARRGVGPTFFDFTLLFRAVGIALWQPTRLLLALGGVIASVLLGLGLDAVWPASASPVAVRVAGHWTTESALYAQLADSQSVRSAMGEAVVAGGETSASGVFRELLLQSRLIEDQCLSGVFGLDPRGLLAAGRAALMTIAWLVSMHAMFAILYGLGLSAIWGFVGVGICRGVALAVARNDEPSLREYRDVCASQWMQGAMIPMLPVLLILATTIGLWLFGLIGAIPVAGKLIVSVAFPIVILGGAIMAIALTLGVAAGPMAPYGVVAGGADAGDAIVGAASFVVERPVKTLFYYAVSFVVGVVAFAALKWLVALSLWFGGGALGMTMDIGAAPADSAGGAPHVGTLEALWTSPSLSGASAFYGTFPATELGGASWVSRQLIRLWLMLTWGVLAAFAVSYAYAATGISWFLLRREVDHTDITEVVDENADKESGSRSVVS
ncbi:MAG TPA: hypothetical protein P5081_10815 [Phycisphaerae bacterium]|nr:hypothetical protein [Phycisphaerae bacterium]HRW53370.1 hypothetical protein [Phycisphaerae bacterium]